MRTLPWLLLSTTMGARNRSGRNTGSQLAWKLLQSTSAYTDSAMEEVILQAVSDDALDRQLIVLQDVAWRVIRVLRLQNELALFLCKARYQDTAIEAGNHHMPRPCSDSAADDQMTTIEDYRPSHAVTACQHDVGVQRIDIQQLIQRLRVFHVVQRWAGWNVCAEERQAWSVSRISA